MTHKQISEVAGTAATFFKDFGKHPDLKEMIEVYHRINEELGNDPEVWSPSTVFEAFCLMYDVAQTDENRIVFRTVRVLFDNLIE